MKHGAFLGLILSTFIFACDDGGGDDGGGECVEGATCSCPGGQSGTRVCQPNSGCLCGGGDDVGVGDDAGRCSPSEEICDGEDNDCNGTIDDVEPQICDMGGFPGYQSCVNGAWGQCSETGPGAEDCNGLDDDGDGRIDEDLRRSCNTACGSGVETCEVIDGQPQWANCTARQPEPEACNGIDDDCDGHIDEHLDRTCQDPLCGTSGEESCVLGQWTICSALGPNIEVCNGADDDCDGEIDEGLYQPCQTACGEGQRACIGGAFSGECEGRQPEPAETCGNGIDDDCNGATDDGCNDCTPGEITECSSAIGACTPGQSTCSDAGEWGPCLDASGEPVQLPGDEPETCDGIDNDCDGFVDEDDPSVGDICGSDVGQCEEGLTVCEGGALMCAGGREGSPEICDDLDNDCDGEVDEDLAGDVFEPNESCPTAEDLGELAENNEPRLVVASLYPDDDVDFYFLRAAEGVSACVPGLFSDDAFEVFVEFTPPEGGDYQVCVTVYKKRSEPTDCFSEDLEIIQERSCSGAGQTSYTSLARCGLDDSMDIIIEVESSTPACDPYTLSFWSATVVEEEG